MATNVCWVQSPRSSARIPPTAYASELTAAATRLSARPRYAATVYSRMSEASPASPPSWFSAARMIWGSSARQSSANGQRLRSASGRHASTMSATLSTVGGRTWPCTEPDNSAATRESPVTTAARAESPNRGWALSHARGLPGVVRTLSI